MTKYCVTPLLLMHDDTSAADTFETERACQLKVMYTAVRPVGYLGSAASAWKNSYKV